MKEYKIGDIFELDDTYSEIAKYCNERRYVIERLPNSGNDTVKFQILGQAEIPKTELAVQEIRRLKARLKETDYKAIKFSEGELSEEEFFDTREQRKAWRKRINELEATLSLK